MLEILSAWRNRRRDARLIAKRVRSFAAADVLIVSYTRSGRTWLRVLRYLNRWAEERCSRPGSLLARYEDLAADTKGGLGRTASFIGLESDLAVLERVTRFASCDHLQTLERQDFSASDRLGLTQAGQSESAKVRKGKVLGYLDCLSLATIAWVDRQIQTEPDPLYG